MLASRKAHAHCLSAIVRITICFSYRASDVRGIDCLGTCGRSFTLLSLLPDVRSPPSVSVVAVAKGGKDRKDRESSWKYVC